MRSVPHRLAQPHLDITLIKGAPKNNQVALLLRHRQLARRVRASDQKAMEHYGALANSGSSRSPGLATASNQPAVELFSGMIGNLLFQTQYTSEVGVYCGGH